MRARPPRPPRPEARAPPARRSETLPPRGPRPQAPVPPRRRRRGTSPACRLRVPAAEDRSCRCRSRSGPAWRRRSYSPRRCRGSACRPEAPRSAPLPRHGAENSDRGASRASNGPFPRGRPAAGASCAGPGARRFRPRRSRPRRGVPRHGRRSARETIPSRRLSRRRAWRAPARGGAAQGPRLRRARRPRETRTRRRAASVSFRDGSAPHHPLAERRDVGDVVPPVPGVERDLVVEVDGALLGVREGAGEVLRGE